MINLYGYIDFDFLETQYYRIFNIEKSSNLNIIKDISDIVHKQSDFILEDKFIVDKIIYNDKDDFSNFLNLISNKPYYILDKKDIENYSNICYIETNEYVVGLEKYIKSIVNKKDDYINEFLLLITNIARKENNIDKMIKIFNKSFIIPNNPKHIAIINKYLIAICNHSRKWINRGYTSNDVHSGEKNKESQFHHLMEKSYVKDVKIGRNDPCLCGSGKKYKKCCG
ncbi:MAG: SEC-C domain-containing protein [Oscillospiraceae bacterium]|nr:SEC-C domain-containing protein [Oscillospiraceae bacterium]